MASYIYLSKDDDKVVTNGNDADDSDSETPVNGNHRNGKDSESAEAENDCKDQRNGADSESAASPQHEKLVDTPLQLPSPEQFAEFNPHDHESCSSVAFAMKSVLENAKNDWFVNLSAGSLPPDRLDDFKKLYSDWQTVSKALDFISEKYVVECCRSPSGQENSSPGHAADTSPSAKRNSKRKRSPSVKENSETNECHRINEGEIEEEFNEDIVCSHG